MNLQPTVLETATLPIELLPYRVLRSPVYLEKYIKGNQTDQFAILFSMKSLSLARPLVIMVIGIPGSGKSFFARQFSTMFAAPLVSTDYIRHAMFPDSTYGPDEDARVSVLVNNEISELLKTQKTIIVDGSLNNRISRSGIERLAKIHGYGTMTIWVQTDEPTSRNRSVKRNSKREGDALNSPMSAEVFSHLSKQLTPPQPTENTVVISGKHTFGTQARVVLKKLVAPRDEVTPGLTRTDDNDPHQPSDTNDIQPRRRSVTIN